jgi:hypothetical protein
MLLEAEAAGLLIDATRAAIMLGQTKPLPYSFMPDFVAPDNTTDPHDSLHGLWWALELFPRPDAGQAPPHSAGVLDPRECRDAAKPAPASR